MGVFLWARYPCVERIVFGFGISRYRANCVWFGHQLLSSKLCLVWASAAIQRMGTHRCTSLIRKRPPPYDPPRTLSIGLRQGLRRVRFLMSEVPLYGP